MKFFRFGTAAALTSALAPGGEIFGYPGGPVLPGVPFCVHDPARPQPPVVTTAKALTPAPPPGAQVLFDGSSLVAWTSRWGRPSWEIRDGVLVARKRDLQTRQAFGAIQLHLEWRCPAGRPVNGQSGGNSGVFLMGLYEIQILQSHQNPTYADGHAGAVYGQFPPRANATLPQGEWQSFDITFQPPVYGDHGLLRPAIVHVVHNGVTVQDNTACLGPTRHRELATYPTRHPTRGPLRLQFHGDPIEFRNIWLKEQDER